MPKWWKFLLMLTPLYFLRLAFGLWAVPVQPYIDEIQTYLLGLKYYATGAWPYYGNDVIKPPDNLLVVTQDPGALQALLIGLPLRLWPSPISPFILLNLISLGGLFFLGYYFSKRLPKLSPWFIIPWILTTPWNLHYSTSMLNVSYTIAGASVFFVAFLESMPPFSLKWMPLPLANVLMGFALFWNMQLHRTWVLLPVFLLVSFFFQWKSSKSLTAPFYCLLGGLPLFALMVPTLLQSDYHFFRDVSGLSFAFNFHNLKSFPVTLVQFLVMAGFEMPRFIGGHTADRIHFLAQHWYLWPGFFLWYFGILQVLLWIGYMFDFWTQKPEWKAVQRLLLFTFALVYVALLFTLRNPDLNHFYELLPVVMLFSLSVWDRWCAHLWGRRLLWFFLASVLVFQTGYVLVQAEQKQSFYMMYQEKITQAIQQKDYRLLGERRPGTFY